MRQVTCKLCDRPVRKKCTKCGNMFCEQHIRYGNPYHAFEKLVEGSNGNYCDICWAEYEKIFKKKDLEGKIQGYIVLLGLIGWAIYYFFIK